MKKGSWKATWTNSGGVGLAFVRNSASVCVCGTEVMSTGSLNLGSDTIPMNSGSAFIPFDISVIFCRRSTFLPLYIAKSSINIYYFQVSHFPLEH